MTNATHDQDDTTPSDEPSQARADWPRSYLRRQGHATRAQKRALHELWPLFGLDAPYDCVLELDDCFERRGAHRVLDIGFGMGHTLIARAELEPQTDILGVEVHRPGLGAALLKIEESGCMNIRVVRHDVFQLLGVHVKDASLDEVTLFFPEPWPKDRDNRRRIVRPLLLEHLERVLRPGGSTLRLATDVEDYAEYMLDVMNTRPHWRNLSTTGRFSPRCPWRPITPYEQKGMDEGRTIFDLHFILD